LLPFFKIKWSFINRKMTLGSDVRTDEDAMVPHQLYKSDYRTVWISCQLGARYGTIHWIKVYGNTTIASDL
jgi:hypothetical protein